MIFPSLLFGRLYAVYIIASLLHNIVDTVWYYTADIYTDMSSRRIKWCIKGFHLCHNNVQNAGNAMKIKFDDYWVATNVPNDEGWYVIANCHNCMPTCK